MRLPRQLLVVAGSAAIIASIAVAGLSFSLIPTATATVGEPTPDPCEEESYSGGTSGDLVAFGENGPVCETATEGLPKTHTPTPRPTEGVTEEPEVTNTPAPPPPAATSTPSGGAGAGVTPPNTGTGGGDSAALPWLAVAGAIALLAGGIGSVGFGLRRR